MPIPLISVDAITVRLRDRWLLSDSSWCINTGEQWVVAGPNGSGKTTLAKAVAGLLPVVRGTIRYHGFGKSMPTRAIAYVSSDERRQLWRRERRLDRSRGFAGRFNEATTVRDWLDSRYPRPLPAGAPPDTKIADRLRLGPLMDKPLMDISTGEMSRVLLARELACRPKLLILDEPFEGLDGTGRRELQAVLAELAVSGLTMVLIVHRTEEMLATTTHRLTLDAGRIVGAGPVARPPTADGLPVAGTGPPSPGPQPESPIMQPSSSTAPGTVATNRSEALIDMRSVTVRYGDTVVLDRLSWAVCSGEHWAVTGPNGAGKSTLLKLITGDCLQVHANRVHLFGKPRGAGQSLGSVRRRLGVVSHDLASSYQKRISAMDVVCSGFFDSVGLYRHCEPGQRRIAARWLERLGLAADSRTFFDRLSQGQRQMVLIARAMVKSPRLLILDEPCSGLDAANRRTVLNLVESIGSGGQTGLLFVTHHEQEMPGCITHRLELDRGVVKACGPIGRQAVDGSGKRGDGR